MNPSPSSARRQRGFTLVEAMIAIVVSLVVTLAITKTFAVSESFRRTGTAGGDASFSGAIGTYQIDHDLAAAGYGINSAVFLGCPVTLSDQSPPSGPSPRVFSFTLAPAVIVPGASNQATDEIWLVASGTDLIPGPINLSVAMASPTDTYTVTNAYGVNAGELLLLAQAGQNCTLVQATNTPTAGATNQNVIKHVSGSYTVNGSNVTARYNPVSGLGPAYASSAEIMDMGAIPTVNRYYIQNHTLMLDREVSGELAQSVAANIVQLKAFYGEDTVGDGMVHVWTNTRPLNANQWASVLAVRIALVAQSANPEKPGNLSTGTCSTTTTLPSVTWDDGTTTTLDVSVTASTATTNWTCYRYKVFHMTTSLRNLIWTPQ